jgi:hypothetical protein
MTFKFWVLEHSSIILAADKPVQKRGYMPPTRMLQYSYQITEYSQWRTQIAIRELLGLQVEETPVCEETPLEDHG